jgi:EAL domain-containing protein (putative c-di-GMP-specific phosphodiesterase class I)
MTFAERSRMISEVDMYVCRAALSRIMSEEALSGFSLSVNLSGASLQNDIFVDSLFRMLGRASACSRRLVFEIMESARIEKLERVGKIIERLRRFGFQVGLDDFGAGYNSFATLNSLDVDFIKIDGAYVTKVLR